MLLQNYTDTNGVYFDGCDYKAIYLNYMDDLDIRLDLRCNNISCDDWKMANGLLLKEKEYNC